MKNGIKILFVCHGNICRSTMCESVMAYQVEKKGLSDVIEVQSAATSREEIGNGPHYGTVGKLRQVGIPVIPHRAVQMTKADYDNNDYDNNEYNENELNDSTYELNYDNQYDNQYSQPPSRQENIRPKGRERDFNTRQAPYGTDEEEPPKRSQEEPKVDTSTPAIERFRNIRNSIISTRRSKNRLL